MIHHPSKTNIDIATDTDIDHDTDIDIATDVNIDTDIDIDIDTDIDELSPVKDWQLLQSESHLLQTRAHVSEQTKFPIWNYHKYSLDWHENVSRFGWSDWFDLYVVFFLYLTEPSNQRALD